MSKKKQKSKRRKSSKLKSSKAAARGSGETQRAESITVFWTTCVLATVLGEAGGLIARLVIIFADSYPALELLSALLLLIAAVTGMISLGLLPLVYRWRRVPPPVAIVRFSIGAAVLPFVIFAALILFRS